MAEKNASIASAAVAASVVAHPEASVPAAAVSAPLAAFAGAGCRALRVQGDAHWGSLAVNTGTLVEYSNWLDLSPGSSLTLKHPSSGREFALAGPARLRACDRGHEELLLARGKLEVAGNLGSRPGAEVLIATPALAITYADAEFTLSVDDKSLRIQVRAGQVEVHPALANQRLKPRLQGKEQLLASVPRLDLATFGKPCEEAAEAAKAAALRVADASSPEPLGERAQAHVRARRAARIACAIAAATTGLAADDASGAGLWAEVERWDGWWESIPPRARSAPHAEK